VDSRELATLQMENELLAHEIRHLRARLAQGERAFTKAAAAKRDRQKDKLTKVRSRLDQEKKLRRATERKNARLLRRLEGARAAQEDLRWLLERLDGSVAGPLLRRRAGFRALTKKYTQGRERP
jgi:hypothetical protein